MSNHSHKPDFTVSLFVKDSKPTVKGKCGVAWVQDDGSIQIKLDHCVVLQGPAYQPNLLITLFPTDDYRQRAGLPSYEESRKHGMDARAADKAGQRIDFEDDIPF